MILKTQNEHYHFKLLNSLISFRLINKKNQMKEFYFKNSLSCFFLSLSYTHTCTHIHTHIYIYIFICIYMHIYVCLYVYTQKKWKRWKSILKRFFFFAWKINKIKDSKYTGKWFQKGIIFSMLNTQKFQN